MYTVAISVPNCLLQTFIAKLRTFNYDKRLEIISQETSIDGHRTRFDVKCTSGIAMYLFGYVDALTE